MSVRSSDVDPRIGPQPLVELVPADVDGHHRGGARLEQAVGEPAGGRPGVERATPATAMAKRSRAAASFSPPRPT